MKKILVACGNGIASSSIMVSVLQDGDAANLLI